MFRRSAFSSCLLQSDVWQCKPFNIMYVTTIAISALPWVLLSPVNVSSMCESHSKSRGLIIQKDMMNAVDILSVFSYTRYWTEHYWVCCLDYYTVCKLENHGPWSASCQKVLSMYVSAACSNQNSMFDILHRPHHVCYHTRDEVENDNVWQTPVVATCVT